MVASYRVSTENSSKLDDVLAKRGGRLETLLPDIRVRTGSGSYGLTEKLPIKRSPLVAKSETKIDKIKTIDSTSETVRVFEAANSQTHSQYEIPTGFSIGSARVHVKIDCDFKLQNHPEIETFIEYAYKQGVRVNLYPSDPKIKEGVKDKSRKSYFVHLGVNTIPDSKDQRKLQAMVDWILLLFAFDNVIDDREGKIPTQEATLKKYTDFLSKSVQGDVQTDENAIAKYLREQSIPEEEIESALKPYRLALFLADQSHAFHREARRYFESSLLEMYRPKTMNLNMYLSVRKDSGAIESVTRLAEDELPDYFMNSAYFKHMNSDIVDYIWAINDLGGAKEFTGHEPAYLKIQSKAHYVKSLKVHPQSDKIQLQIQAFETSLEELLELINDAHAGYFRNKSLTLASIEDGSIFNQSSKEAVFKKMSEPEQIEFKARVKADFLERCAIRENLAAAGNECTRVSSRYLDLKDPDKNVDLTVPWQL